MTRALKKREKLFSRTGKETYAQRRHRSRGLGDTTVYARTELEDGGGCHWCTEAVFQAMEGVQQVDQGWLASFGGEDWFSEGVVVSYDPATVNLFTLVEAHLHTHSSTSSHQRRHLYRSAVYAFDEHQAHQLRFILKELQKRFSETLVTKVLPFRAFRLSDERYRNYYKTRPSKPFCIRHIAPKLEHLQALYGAKSTSTP